MVFFGKDKVAGGGGGGGGNPYELFFFLAILSLQYLKT